MKQQIKLWGTRVLTLAIIVFAVYHWGVPIQKKYFTPKKEVVYIPTAKVGEGPFTVSFHEIGTLKAEKSVPVNSEINGKIIYLIDEGTIVAPGDRLAELDTSDLEREVRNETLGYKNALADVDRAKAELEILKASNETDLKQSMAQLNFDKTELERSKNNLDKRQRLAKDRLITQTEVEQAEYDVRAKELQVEKGEEQYKLKEQEVQSKEQQKKSDVRNVEFRATMARISLEEMQRRTSNAIIKAPAAGMVILAKTRSADGTRKFQEGDDARPRQMICELPDLTRMQVRVQLGEADAPKVKIGLPALIRLDAVPNRIFHGTIKDIASLATEAMPWEVGSTPGRRSFEITIAVKEVEPKTLKPGMTSDVEFICKSIDRTLYVPMEAVIESQGKTYVFVKEGKNYRKVPVETGINNDNFICIKKGLRKGDVIALKDPNKAGSGEESGAGKSDAKKKPGKQQPAPIPEVGKK